MGGGRLPRCEDVSLGLMDAERPAGCSAVSPEVHINLRAASPR